MENLFFIALFIIIFLIIYNILAYKQKRYVPQLSETAKRSTIKEGLAKITYLSPFGRRLAAQGVKKGLVRDLATAGNPLGAVEYYVLVLVCSAVGFVLGVIAMKIMAKKEPNLLIPLFTTLIGFFLPVMWLKQRIKKRQQDITRNLPNVIDLLNLCVGSGVDFMMAVQRVIKDYKPCALTEELNQLWRENNMGTPRREALRNLSWRVNLPEMSSFVSTLIQADKMGTPISDALEIQAEQIRIKRFQKGEENALKAPIKLLIPLIFFILPVIGIIVAAPILLQFLKGGIKF
ncbi:MAG: type II secretion system F family protein [Candidatus Omnitrophica bacterium]|nr:type II secretion system F family protein [Candidatus Omnitrophota bacterium]